MSNQPRSIFGVRSAGMLSPSVFDVGVRVDGPVADGALPRFASVPLLDLLLPAFDIVPLLGTVPLFCVVTSLPADGIVEPFIGGDWLELGIVSVGVMAPGLVGRPAGSVVWAYAKPMTPIKAVALAAAMRIREVFM